MLGVLRYYINYTDGAKLTLQNIDAICFTVKAKNSNCRA